ncbi:hypothetical protein BGZ61DRAFT_577923 [Ilyonectria robusta]|uniref:uncharacterized protein n=1 Tax=Ilyonectria robusta TaxID=1079257 RepID=UPI001E8DBF34|nr:uncharacterized protein BGZ61DRAFT_577923 [Ilyonectria robusta]KAH8650448.1 hypothetical protein BGZ61DRAFT_577923 [Ilyonectria robusta]
MAALIKLPTEVLQQILLHVHDGFQRHRFGRYHPPLGRYELKGINHRANLCSLRSVNRLFNQLVTPLLFQHAVITSSSGVTRLQQLSKNPSLRGLVRRLEICVEVQPITDFDAFDAKLKTNEDKNLKYLARLAIVIHSTLPRFSGLKILKLDFTAIPYRLDRENYDLGSPDGYWEQDTANLFESLATAMRRSQLNRLDEVDLSLPLAFDFGHFLDDDDDNDDDTKPHSTRALFQRLKHLRLTYEHCTDEGEGVEFRWRQPNEEYDKYIRQLLLLAPNIHSLTLQGSDVLMLDQPAIAPLRLRSLDLQSLSITGDAFTALIQQSIALEDVILRGVYLESGTWKEILSAMSQLPITSFYIETCGYQIEGENGDFRPLSPGFRPSDAFIETTEADDLDACEAVFSQVQENKRQIYGSKYDEAADVERRGVELRTIEMKWDALTEFMKRRYAAEVSEDESSEVEITDTEASDSE